MNLEELNDREKELCRLIQVLNDDLANLEGVGLDYYCDAEDKDALSAILMLDLTMP